MLQKTPPSPILRTALALALGLASFHCASAEDSMKAGKADLKSAGALELGPGGVLFVGDSLGSAVYALDVSPPEASGSGPIETVEELDEKIAAMLGTRARDILIKDMAVHPPSGTVYLSVMRGRGDDAVPVIVQVARGGEISEIDLANVRHSKLELPNAPAADAMLYRWESRTLTITDLEFIDGELYIAGLTNEEFASRLRRVPFPFGDVEVTGLEIYHGAHGAYETFAPIFSFIPYDIGGEEHLLAGYLCTPLVTFPLDEIKRQQKLRGKTIAELGYGNIPTDLIAYTREGEDYVLVVNSSRGTMRLNGSDIAAAQAGDGITTEVGARTGVEDHTVPIGHVAQAADFDASHIVVLRRSMENGSLGLHSVPKRRL